MSTTTTTRRTRTPRKAAAAKVTPEAKAVETQPETQPEPEPEPEPEPAAVEETTDQEPDYTYLADKDPSALHERMAEWLTEKTGVEITAKSVQLVMSLRQTFRTSDAGRELVEARNEAAAKRRAEEAKAKKAAAKKKIAELQKLLDAEA